MKKYKNLVACAVVLCLLLGIFGINKIKADSKFSDQVDILKKETSQRKANDKSSVIVKANDFNITENDIQVYIKAYQLKKESDPRASAIKHLVERNSLYNKALKLNYSVTEAEVDAQIAQVKEAVKTTENYSDYLNFVNEYGGEDVYWADIRETTKETMIINKYLNDEKEKYFQNNDTVTIQDSSKSSNGSETESSGNILENWNKQKEVLTDESIKDEGITINDSNYKDLFNK